jgi:hypothetical protein
VKNEKRTSFRKQQQQIINKLFSKSHYCLSVGFLELLEKLVVLDKRFIPKTRGIEEDGRAEEKKRIFGA